MYCFTLMCRIITKLCFLLDPLSRLPFPSPAHLHVFDLFPTSVERYNPQENRWHTVSPMGTRRKHLGCAVYQDMIYSVGGRDDTTELSSAERYNPRTNQWSPVVAMTSRRSGVRTRMLRPPRSMFDSQTVVM